MNMRHWVSIALSSPAIRTFEEAYRVGELLFLPLDVNIPSIPQPQPLHLQGEAVANEFIPRKVAQS